MPEPDLVLLSRLTAPDAATTDPPRRRPRVNGVAYTGGPIALGNFDAPIVVDLSGLEIPASVPLLANHDNRTAARVGVVRAWVAGDALHVAGEILSSSGTAAGIVEQGTAGADWQLSIGAETREVVRVRAGQKAHINGRWHNGPLHHIRKAILREISVIPVGADADTSLSIAATWRLTQNQEEQDMDGMTADYLKQLVRKDREIEAAKEAAEAPPPVELDPAGTAVVADALTAERTRVAQIHQICGEDDRDLAAEAVREGWTTKLTAKMKVRLINARRPTEPPIMSLPESDSAHGDGFVPSSDTPRNPAVARLLAAVCLKAGYEHVAVDVCGPEVTESVRKRGPDNTTDIVAAALRAEREDVPRGRDEMIRAGLSTNYLPGVLETFGRRVLLNAYTESPATWRTFARVQSVPDFRAHDLLRLSSMRPLERVAPGGEIKHGSLTEEPRVRFKADTFGEMLGIDRRDLTNDDLGAFANLAQGLGIAAARTLNDCFWSVLLDDDTGHFSKDNKNLLKGADSCLTVESLGQAISLMHTRRDDKGNDLDLQPAVLVVPPELERTARALLESDQVIASPTKVMPSGNSLKHAVKLAVDARLSNTDKFKHAGAKRWLLATAPLHIPAIVAFLDGRERPTVEALGLQADVNRLAFMWRVYFDFGAALGDPKSSVFSIGE